MEYRNFGNTGIRVSALGFGAGHIGNPEQDERDVDRLLGSLEDLGINLIDTARSYGESEARIGRWISSRRNHFILSTKVGYTFGNLPDWSYEATMGSLEESLVRLQTDYIDIVHLHSCDLWVLERGESISALEKAREQGKIRVIAYSGENEALDFAIRSGRFGSIQCSVNIFDQRGITKYLPAAAGQGMGIIAKRPLGNAVWRYTEKPNGHGHSAYYDRYHEMNPDSHGLPWSELALRFSVFTESVSAVITGTSGLSHLTDNVAIVSKGRLPSAIIDDIHSRFKKYGDGWNGLI